MFLESARHPVNIGHLVMGIAFLGLVVVWALIEADAVGGNDIRWLLPVPWMLAGLAGLLATTLPGRGPATQTGSLPTDSSPAPSGATRYDSDDSTGGIR